MIRWGFKTKQREGEIGIVVAKSEEMVNLWVESVAGCKVIGLDIEYKPNFKKGCPLNKTSLLQLSAGDCVVLIQLFQVKCIPNSLAKLLEDPSITKAGVGIDDDVKKLLHDWKVTVRGAVDLSKLMQTKYLEPTYLSLAKLSLKLLDLDMHKRKKISISNWEKPQLTPEQIQYAALDAWVGSECFSVLDSTAKST